jgi:hypothetical protein
MNKKSVSLRALIVAHEKERRDIEQLVPLEVEILSCANTVERGTKLDGKHVKRLNKLQRSPEMPRPCSAEMPHPSWVIFREHAG